MSTSRLTRLTAIFTLVFTLAFAAMAFASSFTSSSSSVNANGTLHVAWTYSGAGCGSAGSPCNFSVAATVKAFYGCQNGGGNFPRAQNKNASTGSFSAPAGPFFRSGGQVSGTLDTTAAQLPAPPASVACGTGQTLVLVRVEYTGITISINTDNKTDSTTAPNASANGPFS